MGGHGGLNILPQKRWNVYNYENREKVRKDEEAAAREEQLKREQARERDAEFRLEQLRAARDLAPLTKPEKPSAKNNESESKLNHINLFERINIFDPIKGVENEGNSEREGSKKKKKKKKEEVKAVTAKDEKYRLGYGVAGKGVKLPCYFERRNNHVNEERDDDNKLTRLKEETKSEKTILEKLSEERLKKEKQEKENDLVGENAEI